LRALPFIVACVFISTCSQRPPILEQIKELGELRVVTRNSPTAYYQGSHGPTGPEYDLVRLFAERLGVELAIYTTKTLQEILPEVDSGKAHLAAASLTATDERSKWLTFGPAYQEVTQQLVYRLGTPKPQHLEDLLDRHIEVIAGSADAETLREIRHEYPELAWVENPHTESAELLERLAKGEIELTIVDSTEFAIARNYHPELRVAMDLSEAESLAWAFVNDNDKSLRNEVSAFFAGLERSGELQALAHRYYGHRGKFDYVGTRSFMRHVQSRLPRYRGWFEQAAAVNRQDWRLIAAIGYQESHWMPSAVSPTGVRGIMMLTQTTARQMGIDNRIDPRKSIFGGAQYFSHVKARIPEAVAEPDRTWFALAAYNVGLGHVEDARYLTEMHGRDPDKWIDVREHLPLLGQSKWYKQLKRGYARGWEPVLYVDNIRSYYDILQWVTTAEEEEAESPLPSDRT